MRERRTALAIRASRVGLGLALALTTGSGLGGGGDVAAATLGSLHPLAFMRPRPAAPGTIEGRWVASGDAGTWDVTIAAAGGAFTYDATARVRDAADAADAARARRERGLAMIRGGQLFVAFPPSWGGITVYRVAADGSARGEWAEQHRAPEDASQLLLGEVELDAPRVGTGDPSGALLGEHAWRSRAGGQVGPLVGARSALVVNRADAALHFRWAPSMEGVGLQRGDCVAAVWGTSQRRMGLAAYDLEAREIRGVRVTLGEPGVLRSLLARAP